MVNILDEQFIAGEEDIDTSAEVVEVLDELDIDNVIVADEDSADQANNQIIGTPENDVIIGSEQDDEIFALEGDDIVVGDPGRNSIGNDTIDGGGGNDRLVGRGGRY